MTGLILAFWFDPGRVTWTKNGTVVAAHQYTDSSAETNWNVLVYIYQQSDLGYLVNTGYVALNGPGTANHGNYCWNDGNNKCLSTPQSFNMNQTLTVEALNNGNFVIKNHQL